MSKNYRILEGMPFAQMATATALDGLQGVLPHDTDMVAYRPTCILWRSSTNCNLHIHTIVPNEAAQVTWDRWFYGDVGVKFHVIEFPFDETASEAQRDCAEAYSRNPWSRDPFMRDNPSIWAEHMPRASKTVEGMLDYYATPAHRLARRLTTIKPGRYLRRFFSEHLSEPQIEEMALVWSNAFAPRKLHITTDANEIEAIYRRGPSSCMTFRGGEFRGIEHPARVYAGPDLAVAYIGSLEKPEGRAVVWPEKMIWARTYGDDVRLEAALEKAGYREGESRDFDGARVRRIESCGAFVMPYLDVCGAFDDDGEWLVLSRNGDHDAETTSGLAGDCNCTVCELCNDRVDEDEAQYVERADGYVCDCCYGANYFYCEETGEHCRLSDRAATRGEEFVSEDGVMASGRWFFCEGDDEWVRYSDDDAVVLDDGRCVSMTWADTHAFRCEASEEWVERTGANLVAIDQGEHLNADFFRCDLDRIARWCIDNDRIPVSATLQDIMGQLRVQLELDLEAA